MRDATTQDMLPIPKDLVGYTAESFISYGKPNAELRTFLVQRFEHKMIPYYFDGWKKLMEEKYTGIVYIGGVYQIKFQHKMEFSGWSHFEYDRMTITNHKENVEHVILKLAEIVQPDTVEQFISDCLRTGIKLLYKKE